MSFAYGLLGIGNTIAENRKEKQRKAALPDMKKVLDREMEEFCDKKAAEYGITRGVNLVELQMSIANADYYYEEMLMKNEDAGCFSGR